MRSSIRSRESPLPTRRRRRNATTVAACVLAMVLVLQPLQPVAKAWKPTSHVYFAELALEDALNDGMVTIHRVDYAHGEIIGETGEYAVDPAILAALRSNLAQYRAGVLGPDAYPDMLTGQQVIHPGQASTGIQGGADAWLRHLWLQGVAPGSGTPATSTHGLKRHDRLE